ncbi:Hypothetical predicted protein [Mytilus galloprovincialis]|uniref:Uncharacterized protein n=1 Tax=Mytilus galloprovincialis TaxID=29158 RepID=A0A8B6GJ13_MYTGA|nr:Hypothetical predicted protein [Mytilus galloprovincialis]
MPSFVSIQVIDTPFVSEYLFDSERENSVFLVSSFEVSNLLNVPDVQMVCCIDDGRILLANCLFPHLYLCKNDGSEVANIYLSESPIDMACYDLNRALVIVMNKGVNLINLTTKTCEEFIIKDNLCSICSVNSVIWVGSLSKELLQINIEGEILQTISTYFPLPKICVNQIDGEVYCLSPGPVEISDHKSDVYVIFPAGNTKFLCSISKEYSDIAVDGDGEVFVIGGKSIIKTSNYKREQKNIIIEVNGFENPLRVRYNNKTEDTVILNNGGKTVDVYKLC